MSQRGVVTNSKTKILHTNTLPYPPSVRQTPLQLAYGCPGQSFKADKLMPPIIASSILSKLAIDLTLSCSEEEPVKSKTLVTTSFLTDSGVGDSVVLLFIALLA